MENWQQILEHWKGYMIQEYTVPVQQTRLNESAVKIPLLCLND
jgi:hypothetical protein